MPRNKYIPSPAHLKAVEQMALKGVSHTKMAKALGISRATFVRNKEHFEAHIKKGRDSVDEEAVKREIEGVENSLLKRCMGTTFEEETIEGRRTGEGEPWVYHKKTVKKVIQPSDTAIMYYLGNRSPDKWKSVNHAPEPSEEKLTELTAEESRAFMKRSSGGSGS